MELGVTVTKSLKLYAISLCLAGIGAYILWFSVEYEQWGHIVWGLSAILGSLGLIFQKYWSQYIVYILSFSITVFWLYEIIKNAIIGWPYEETLDTIISLVPGVFLFFICLISSIIVYKHFRSLETKQ